MKREWGKCLAMLKELHVIMDSSLFTDAKKE